ncbi:MAG: hypothetical protein ACR2OX_03895 [Methyloligellaceae bacterium]
MYPFFSLQAKLAQCTAEIMLSAATAATSIATTSLNAAAKTVSETAQKSKTPRANPWQFPSNISSGSGFPMFEPLMFPATQAVSNVSPALFAFEWPKTGFSWPFSSGTAWPTHVWSFFSTSPFALFANPIQRKRSVLEQTLDPFGFWSRQEPETLNPLALANAPYQAAKGMLPSAKTIDNSLAATAALMGPFFLKKWVVFPGSSLGI